MALFSDMNDYLSLLIQIVCAVGFAGMILVLSVLCGKRGKNVGSKNIPYECGMIPSGDGAPQFSVKFYILAMLFVVFDIEVVFLYPWAVTFQDIVMKNPGAFWTMVGFVGVLLVAYVYAWRKGALRWTRAVK